MMRLLLLLALFTGCPKRVAPEPRHEHHFEHAEEWAARFEDPSRDGWQKPDEVILALGLPKQASLVDLGSATGYFSVRFAKWLTEGRVFGVDVESSMVEYLAKRAKAEKLPNLEAILGEYDDPKLPQPVDCILVVNTYHHVQQRPLYFANLKSKLKPGGRLVVIDFKKGSEKGPPDSEKLTPAQVTRELEDAGYSPISKWNFLPDQYFLAFTVTAPSK